MKTRPSLDLVLINRDTAEQIKIRILAKPCRNLRTRYWLVLPCHRSQRERWFMEPTLEHVLQRASAWLMRKATTFFSPTGLAESDSTSGGYKSGRPTLPNTK